jgi:hypothetical protein
LSSGLVLIFPFCQLKAEDNTVESSILSRQRNIQQLQFANTTLSSSFSQSPGGDQSRNLYLNPFISGQEVTAENGGIQNSSLDSRFLQRNLQAQRGLQDLQSLLDVQESSDFQVALQNQHRQIMQDQIQNGRASSNAKGRNSGTSQFTTRFG